MNISRHEAIALAEQAASRNQGYKAMIKILSESVFDVFATVVDVYGQGCNYPTKQGVDGFQVDFEVEATSQGETEQFHIVYQSAERSDNIIAYNGYEMTTAGKFGVDDDQSTRLDRFMGYEDGIFTEMQRSAEALCRDWLKSHAAE